MGSGCLRFGGCLGFRLFKNQAEVWGLGCLRFRRRFQGLGFRSRTFSDIFRCVVTVIGAL